VGASRGGSGGGTTPILGSVERMFALLAENYGGKWPLWLSPRQVAVLPVSERALEYAENVRRALRTAGLHASVDASARSVQKKVREAQLEQTNYIQSSANIYGTLPTSTNL